MPKGTKPVNIPTGTTILLAIIGFIIGIFLPLLIVAVLTMFGELLNFTAEAVVATSSFFIFFFMFIILPRACGTGMQVLVRFMCLGAMCSIGYTWLQAAGVVA